MTSTSVQSTLPMPVVSMAVVNEVARELMSDRDWLGAAKVLLEQNLPVPVGIWKAMRSYIEEPVRAKDLSIKQSQAFTRKCTAIHRALCSKDKSIRANEVRFAVTELLSSGQERAKLNALNHDGSWLLSQDVDVVKPSHYNGLENEILERDGKPERRWNFSYSVNKFVAKHVKLGGLRKIDDFLTSVIVKIYAKRYDLVDINDRDSYTDQAIDSAQIAEAYSVVGMSAYTQHVSRDPYDMI